MAHRSYAPDAERRAPEARSAAHVARPGSHRSALDFVGLVGNGEVVGRVLAVPRGQGQGERYTRVLAEVGRRSPGRRRDTATFRSVTDAQHLGVLLVADHAGRHVRRAPRLLDRRSGRVGVTVVGVAAHRFRALVERLAVGRGGVEVGAAVQGVDGVGAVVKGAGHVEVAVAVNALERIDEDLRRGREHIGPGRLVAEKRDGDGARTHRVDGVGGLLSARCDERGAAGELLVLGEAVEGVAEGAGAVEGA